MYPLLIGVTGNLDQDTAALTLDAIKQTLEHLADAYPNLVPVLLVHTDHPHYRQLNAFAGKTKTGLVEQHAPMAASEWHRFLAAHAAILIDITPEQHTRPGHLPGCRLVCSRHTSIQTSTEPHRLTQRPPSRHPDAPLMACTCLDSLDELGRDLASAGLGPDADATSRDGGRGITISFNQADRVAIRFQACFNRMLLATHVLAVALATCFLVYSVRLAPDWLLVAVLGLFATGLVFWDVARRAAWHRKRLEYRMLAEILRVIETWEAGGMPFADCMALDPDTMLHLQDNNLDWLHAVIRGRLLAVRRTQRPATLQLDPFRVWIGDDATGQVGFFRKRIMRCERNLRATTLATAAGAATGLALIMVLLTGHTETAKPWIVFTIFFVGVLTATLENYRRKRGDREIARQYRLMHSLFMNARTALATASDEESRRRILDELGHASLLEHAEWLLLHRERPIEISRL
jgi:hypothetical protein